MPSIKGLALVFLGLSAGLAAAAQPADAFSAFKGRFKGGDECQRSGLVDGAPIWPTRDIAVEPPGRATNAASCPSPATVQACQNSQVKSPACTSILNLQQQCTSGTSPADLGDTTDDVHWAGLTPYKATSNRSLPRPHPDAWQTFVAELGTIDVPFDMLVRFPSVAEASPQYHWLAPIYRIGDQAHWSALPSKGEALRSNTYPHGVKQDDLIHHYWVRSWNTYTDCAWCHNPLRGARGPFRYTYGDNQPAASGVRQYTSGRTSAEPVLLEAGSYNVEAGFVCRDEGQNGCYGTMYQQRLRVEFAGCPED